MNPTAEHPAARWAIYQVLSGNLFYVAVGLLTVAGALRIAGAWRPTYRYRGVARGGGAIGFAALLPSLASLTIWWLAYLAALLLACVRSRHQKRSRAVFAAAAAALLVVAGVHSGLYEMGHIGGGGEPQPRIVIFGDGLAAPPGAFEEELPAERRGFTPWPKLLEQRAWWPVLNLASVGGDLRAAREIADRNELTGNLVLLAAGSRDMAGATTIRQFAGRLDRLVGELSESNVVVLIQVPAPPTAPWYGWVQRQVAARHGVRLIPKRAVADALFDPWLPAVKGAPMPRANHRRMADNIHEYLLGWFAEGR